MKRVITAWLYLIVAMLVTVVVGYPLAWYFDKDGRVVNWLTKNLTLNPVTMVVIFAFLAWSIIMARTGAPGGEGQTGEVDQVNQGDGPTSEADQVNQGDGPTSEADQVNQGDGPPIPKHDKWSHQEWDAIFDWFYSVPRKVCQSEIELAAMIRREPSYVRKQKQLYDNSHI